MQGVVGRAGAFVEGGVLVVVAGFGVDSGERCQESEKQSSDGRHGVHPKSYSSLCGVSERCEVVD